MFIMKRLSYLKKNKNIVI